jgi:hypothetical protein
MREELQHDRALLSIYRINGERCYPRVVPASGRRDWIETTFSGWPNRCIPLLIANQNGWVILNEEEFEVIWSGKNSLDALRFSGKYAGRARSMFGGGLITWSLPYLFRTPPGINLWVKGPANSPKDGVCPLEGIVETDWLPYTFTMRWQITHPRTAIEFEKDEPICFITPIRRYEAEQLEPVLKNIESEPALHEKYNKWHSRRLSAVAAAGQDGTEGDNAVNQQGQYIRGEMPDGSRVQNHQNKLKISEVLELEPPANSSTTSDNEDRTEQNSSGRVIRKLFRF